MPPLLTDANNVLWKYSVKNPTGGFDFKCKFCSKEYNDFSSKRCVLSHIKHLAKVESHDADNCHRVPPRTQKGMRLVFEHLKPDLEDLLKNDALPLEPSKVKPPFKSRMTDKMDSFVALVDSGVIKDAINMDKQNTETSKFWEYAVKTPSGFKCKSCSKEYSELNRANALMHVEHLAKLECDDEDVQNVQQAVSELNLNMEGMDSDDARLKMKNKQAKWDLMLHKKFESYMAILRALHQPIA